MTTKQRAHLRALAHKLKPILHVGKDGVTETLARTIAEGFNTRELFKIKVLDTSPEDAREAGSAIAERVAGAIVVQVVGKTLTLYRPHPESPKIKLPQ